MKIIWSVAAKEDIHEIYTYHKVATNLLIAKSIKANIFSETRLLIKHKEMGRIEENKSVVNRGYRFLVSGNYKIVYKIIDENNILIASVFDCRQNPDKMMNKK